MTPAQLDLSAITPLIVVGLGAVLLPLIEVLLLRTKTQDTCNGPSIIPISSTMVTVTVTSPIRCHGLRTGKQIFSRALASIVRRL